MPSSKRRPGWRYRSSAGSTGWPRPRSIAGATLTKSELARLKGLERENARLKKLVAELTLDKQILQDVLSKKD
jgi:hypothetical protein